MSTRSNSLIDKLPPNQREALERWLFDETPRLTYDAAVKRLWEDFNVRCSRDTVFRWYQRKASERSLNHIATSSAKANAVVEHFREHPSQAVEALAGLIGQAAFNAQMEGGETLSLETLKDINHLLITQLNAKHDSAILEIKRDDQKLKREKFEALQKKITDTKKEVQKLRDKGADLSDTERTAILDKVDEILGVKT